MSKREKKISIVLVSLFIFILLCVILKHRLIIDTSLLNYIYKYRTNYLTTFFLFITVLCNKYLVMIYILITIMYFIIKNKKKTCIIIILNTINLFVLNTFFKLIIMRPRPTNRLIMESGYSFPSAHSMLSMGFLGLLFYYVYINKKLNNVLKNIILALIVIAIFLIGFSRIYLGVHYPSDVIGGYSLSLLYLIFFINYVIKNNKLFDKIK